MALTFPPQPQAIGTVYEAPNGINYTWDGTKWVAAGTPGSGGSTNLGNLFIVDQTIAALDENRPVKFAGNVELLNGNLNAFSVHTKTGAGNGGGFTFIDPLTGNETSGMQHFNGDNSVGLIHTGNIGIRVYSNGYVSTNKIISDLYLFANLHINNSRIEQINNELQIHNTPVNVFANLTATTLKTPYFVLNGTDITTVQGTLYVNGVPVGGEGFNNTLQNNGYIATLDTEGNFIIPGNISSTATGIPEFNSSTDLNLNALNRVNVVQSPLNLATVNPSTVIGKPGDLIYNSTSEQVQTYVNGAWENLVRTEENDNIKLPINGAYLRHDGVRAAWITDVPYDISQLTDNQNLLVTSAEQVPLDNINIDGGGAYAFYEVGLAYADGGFSSGRFGPSDIVFDGAGAGDTYTNALNGGGA